MSALPNWPLQRSRRAASGAQAGHRRPAGDLRPASAGAAGRTESGDTATFTLVDWDTFGQVMVAVLAVGAALLQFRRTRGGPRAQIRQDIELLELLPQGPTRDRMVAHVESSVDKLIERETELRRDPMGIGLGIAFIAGAVVAGYFATDAPNFMWAMVLALLAFVFGLIGLVGFIQDVVPRKRDEKGRPIE